MAYIDKLTTLRRFALIWAGYKAHESNGDIVWEGVNIEGTMLMKKVNATTVAAYNLDMPKEAKAFNAFLMSEHLELVYQDPDNEDMWEPRTQAMSIE